MVTAADVALFTKIATKVSREVIASAIRGDGGSARIPVQVKKPAVVVNASGPQGTVSVKVDGDSGTINAINATGRAIMPGARVLVDFIPPHGVFVTGSLNTDWSDEVLIAGGLLAASVASLDVSQIPQDFHHLRLIGSFRTDSGADQDIHLTVNGDSSNVYYLSYHHVSAGVVSAGEGSATSWSISSAPGAPTDNGYWDFCDLRFYNYQAPGLVKRPNMRGERGSWDSGGNLMSTIQGVYNTTVAAAITSMRMVSAAGNINVGSEWALYGCGQRLT